MAGFAARWAQALPWVISAAAVALAITIVWHEQDAGEQRATGRPAVATTIPRADAGAASLGEPQVSTELALLTACADELRRQRAHAGTVGVRSSGELDHVSACLDDPRVQARLASEVESACGACADGPSAAAEAAARARTEEAASSLEAVLAISPAEQALLQQYLCAARDLRGMLAREGVDAGVRDAFERARRERERVVDDVERLLGAERYSRLRAVGGLAVLSDAARCD